MELGCARASTLLVLQKKSATLRQQQQLERARGTIRTTWTLRVSRLDAAASCPGDSQEQGYITQCKKDAAPPQNRHEQFAP
jgi:hypothetical protein